MKKLVVGQLRHGPWDLDPYWFPGKPYPPPPQDLADDSPMSALDGASPLVQPDSLDPLGCEPPRTDEAMCARLTRPPMKILQSAYNALMRHLTSVEPEVGGMLLGPKGSPVVTHYIPDRNGRASAASFTLDAIGLNRILKQFLECDMDAKGLVHSHPSGCTRPSQGDLHYVRRSFGNPKNKGLVEFLLPIVCGEQLHPYIVTGADPPQVLVAELVLF